MSRPSRSRSLSVWTNGRRVGLWTTPSRGDVEFTYDAAWMDSDVGRPLSLSLPYAGARTLKGARVRNYFDNLLPDSEAIRQRLAGRFGTATSDAFDLLEAIGRDCVGAVQLLGEDEEPEDIERIVATPMSEMDVERLLTQTTSLPSHALLDESGELRISLAGAQEKTALLWRDGGWYRPHGSTPTTHILKLPMGLVGHMKADFSTSVENEWLCMNLLAEYGLPVAKTALLAFGKQRVLAVERFDRQWHASGDWLLRLPQEDFCQVTGLASHLKYEADGGPGLAALSRVLAASTQPQADLAMLLKAQIVFWLLAAPDGHAKNFSLRLLPGGRYRMTPLYDVMSIWPIEGQGPNQVSRHRAKMAMAMLGKNKHYAMKDIQRRHFNATAAMHFQRPNAEDLIEQILEQTPLAIERVASRLPPGFPARICDAIFTGLRDAAERLAAMPPA